MKYFVFYFFWVFIFCDDIDILTNYKLKYKYLESCDNFLSECYTNSLLIISNFENGKYSYNTKKVYENPNDKFSLIISEAYYYKGFFEYLGLPDNSNPQLEKSFASFIISSYFSNPKAQYKIYIILSSDLYHFIINSKKFTNLLSSNKILNEISKTKFFDNFNFPEKKYQNEIALTFLYSSALAKYSPAMLALGYKFNNGFGVKKNYKIASEYIIQVAQQEINNNIGYYNNILSPYFENLSLEQFEFINKKFKNINELSEISDIINYYKMKSETHEKKKIVGEIGRLYLFGIRTEQNLEEAFKWFKMGETMNDPYSIYYLGNMYLNGWSVEKDYNKAFNYFQTAVKLGFISANNDIGFMYYYGLGQNKNVDIAFSYFQMGIDKDNLHKSLNSLYNILQINLIENNKFIDIKKAYQFSNFLTINNHLYGTYVFAMMNHYNINSALHSEELNYKFFRYVAERHILNRKRFDYAIKFYKDKKYKTAYLLFLELGFEGMKNCMLNAAILLIKYNIFIDKKYQNYLSKKFLKFSINNENNLFAIYNYALLNYNTKNYKKAIKYYIRLINYAAAIGNKFYISNGYFNLGLMENFGLGLNKNITKANEFYNISIKYEENSRFPFLIINVYNKFVVLFEEGIIKVLFKKIKNLFFKIGIHSILTIVFCFFYIWFYYNLSTQKE
jgi:TPR repeat protein